MSNITIPDAVRTLLRQLNSADFCAYAVGGCVRDSLLGKEPQDWDICTNAHPEQIKACFSDLRTILTGERYGTVTVLHNGIPYEITTFRTESGYSDSRHPDSVVFLNSLQGDLSRRDFTVNAIAADAEGNIIDCFGGISDLQDGIIRCVGNAHDRFTEDALRILRALRFASKLGFEIAPETDSAIHELKDRLSAVAPERLRKELKGLLCGTSTAQILRQYVDVLCVPIPEIKSCIAFCQYNYHHLHDVWEHTIRVVENVPATEVLRLAALFHDIGKPAAFTMDKNLIGHFYGHAVISAAMTETILRRLHFDTATIRLVTLLVSEHDFFLPARNEKRMKKLLAAFGEASLKDLLVLRRADGIGTGTQLTEEADRETECAFALLEQILQQENCFSIRQLAVHGNDLIALGIPQGPAIGIMLNRMLDAVLDGQVKNQMEDLLFFAQNCPPEIENY